jgi:hypothetical protein
MRTQGIYFLVLACGLLLQPVLGQQQQPVRKQPQSIMWGRNPNDNPNNGNMVQLKEPVSLDNLPDFTGHKKFVQGTVRDWELGQAWSECFMCKETPKDVLDWYNQVLVMQQWKIQATNSGQIMAKHKDGNTCQISAQEVRNNKEARCSFSIAYFVPRKK